MYKRGLEAFILIFYSFVLHRPELLGAYIRILFSRTKRHKVVAQHLVKMLDEVRFYAPLLVTYKIKIVGKFNGKLRSRVKLLSLYNHDARQVHQTIFSRSWYSYMEISTYTGIFGIHIWYYFNI
jgi:hypothetical protein